MSVREVVICTPVRTAIGTYGGSLKATPATALGATAIKAVLDRSGPRPGKDRHGRHRQRLPSRKSDEPCTSGGGQRRGAGRSARDDGEPGLRLGRPGRRDGRAGDLARLHRLRDRRRHGEHGHGALPDARRALGSSAGARPAPRRCPDRRAERRLLRPALRLAYRGSRREVPDHARRSGPLRRTLAAALLRRAGRRQVRGRDRSGRGEGPQRTGELRQGRTQPPGHDHGDAGQAAPRLPQGGLHHRRQRAGAEQRRARR